ncbi:hypothetical protein QFC20_005158 [Naganishia adeliensis]|uniref:Uncharacterized protein n=1 Tax=Naganishia adeliensis TaxID=92952 RepID=A0ACC2VR99_9TREE|nr:hypothetical protein QFC20_005158 [Naganishia adeliensis]
MTSTLRLSLSASAAILAWFASSVSQVDAKPCVQFDASWNLYAFGGSEDVSLGQNTTWGSPSASTLTTTGRPPWTGNNTQCFLSQYNNAMYVLNADAAAPSDVYIFNFDAKSWSKQTTSSAPDLASGTSILDHDTNVFFTLPAGSSASLYQLDLNAITNAASSNAVAWEAVSSTSFQQGAGQGVVMAEASNHINFFNVPNNPAGSTSMFVIHYSYFQPEAVAYKTVNGAVANFPTQHGKAIPVPTTDNSANDVMVFVPDDFSSTYVVTHWTSPSTAGQTSDAPAGIADYINSTQTLSAPTSKDMDSSYAASDTALVQIDSTGALYYVTGAFGNGWQVPTGLSWQKLGYTLAGVTGTGSSSVAASSSATGSATGSASSSAAASSTGTAGNAAQSGSRTASGTAASGSAAPSASNTSGAMSSFSGMDVALVSVALSCLGLAMTF